MTLAEQAQKIEKANATLQVDLAKAEGIIQTYKEELGQEREKISKLQNQVDDHKSNPLQEQVKKLRAGLKEANANQKVKKFKLRVQKLEKQLAEEQSCRMKSENHPEIKQENEKLKSEAERLKSENATHHRCRTEADAKATEAEKDMADAVKLAEVYEKELARLGVDHIQLVKSAGLKL